MHPSVGAVQTVTRIHGQTPMISSGIKAVDGVVFLGIWIAGRGECITRIFWFYVLVVVDLCSACTCGS